jgi:hypothetical protein
VHQLHEGCGVCTWPRNVRVHKLRSTAEGKLDLCCVVLAARDAKCLVQ